MFYLYLLIGTGSWLFLYWIVYRLGLYIMNRLHKSSLKRWGADLDDYEYNKTKFKLYVHMYFIGIPILFWIGFIIYFNS